MSMDVDYACIAKLNADVVEVFTGIGCGSYHHEYRRRGRRGRRLQVRTAHHVGSG